MKCLLCDIVSESRAGKCEKRKRAKIWKVQTVSRAHKQEVRSLNRWSLSTVQTSTQYFCYPITVRILFIFRFE